MIRAVIQNGAIKPLDPIPPSWIDGTELSVGENSVALIQDLDDWRRQLEVLVSAADPDDFSAAQQDLSRRDLIDKELMRREMDL